MKISKIILVIMASLLAACSTFTSSRVAHPFSSNPNYTMLSTPVKVYVRNSTVINHPAPGFTARVLPTDNYFHGNPGCYIACYSKNARGAIYSVGGGIYVKGQVRIPGTYVGRICKPRGYESQDISQIPYFQHLCGRRIRHCHNNCWAGGDTGGMFGIQR